MPSGFISRPFIYYSPEGFSLAFGIYFPSIYLLLPRRLFSCLRDLFPVHLFTTPSKAFPLTSNFALFPFPLLNRKLSPCLRDFTSCLFTYYSTESFPLTSGFISRPFTYYSTESFPLTSVFTYCSFLTASSKAFPLAFGFPHLCFRISKNPRISPWVYRFAATS